MINLHKFKIRCIKIYLSDSSLNKKVVLPRVLPHVSKSSDFKKRGFQNFQICFRFLNFEKNPIFYYNFKIMFCHQYLHISKNMEMFGLSTEVGQSYAHV